MLNITSVKTKRGRPKRTLAREDVYKLREIANQEKTYMGVARIFGEHLGQELHHEAVRRWLKLYEIELYKEPKTSPNSFARKARVLYFDIETRMATINKHVYSLKGYSTYENPDNITQSVRLVCIAWQWAGENVVRSASVLNDLEWNKDTWDDSYIVQVLVSLLEKADIAIAHNGDKFDMKMLRARCLELNIKPFREPKIEDTLKVARGQFNLLSNKLSYLARVLELEEQKGRPPSWEEVYHGEPSIIKECERYCRQDIRTLREVAKRVLPWKKGGIDSNIFVEGMTDFPEILICPVATCQSENIVGTNRKLYKNKTAYVAKCCKDCGHIFPVGKNTVKRLLTR